MAVCCLKMGHMDCGTEIGHAEGTEAGDKDRESGRCPQEQRSKAHGHDGCSALHSASQRTMRFENCTCCRGLEEFSRREQWQRGHYRPLKSTP